ncbi:hypothetical protein [Vibrio sp. SCSIO 43136]|uniref:hypothetical protein n=1 Tax=Vibrio sp. SCSIO 43136 TaxID=2819101 RepID=UPI00207623E0|nr:hypothetical protein [Vibrio sp. SCSIO 43136]USD67377.1 hypothetical protein J4N39_22370 [Vibrio sp. SCSIO 43136]
MTSGSLFALLTIVGCQAAPQSHSGCEPQNWDDANISHEHAFMAHQKAMALLESRPTSDSEWQQSLNVELETLTQSGLELMSLVKSCRGTDQEADAKAWYQDVFELQNKVAKHYPDYVVGQMP